MRGREATGDKTVSEIIRIVIAVTLLYALVRFVAVKSSLEEAENARRTLRSEVQVLREETAALEGALSSAPDEEEIEKLARERLGLVMPDETIFMFNQCLKEG
ncbi:MAG: septum formation initiator family protein [Oscillospiraceae bacterium]|nr:septum formation initiator family protein [Oscillospiraceae bacterium]